LKGETLDEFKRRKMMRRKKKLMTGLGFLPIARRALFISTYNGPLQRTKVQYIFTGSYMLARADDNRKDNVSREKMHKNKNKNNTAREINSKELEIFVKKHKFTLSSTRGLAALEEEESITKVKEVDK
jgi:hypothetical protein